MRTLRGLVSRRYTITCRPKALRLVAVVTAEKEGRMSQFEWKLDSPDCELTAALKSFTNEEIPEADDLGPLKELMRRGFEVVFFPHVTGGTTPFVQVSRMGLNSNAVAYEPPGPAEDAEMLHDLADTVNLKLGEKDADLLGRSQFEGA